MLLICNVVLLPLKTAFTCIYHGVLVLKTLQSSNAAQRKTTKRTADEANDVTKKNTLSAVVPPSSSSANHKPPDHVPASIRNIQRLSAMDSQMTNGSRLVI